MSEATISADQLDTSLRRAIDWVQRNNYRGYEPADGNASVLFPLTMGRVFPMRIVQQTVLRSPINIRPLLGVARHESAIARGYMAWGYLRMCGQDARSDLRTEAAICLAWLKANRSPGFADYCWGDPYQYATRSGRRPLGSPILIWTALIGLIFLEAFETLGDEQYLHVAESTGRWIAQLPLEKTDNGSCLSYNAYSQSSIHNSNAMGAAFLARLGALTRNASATALARETMTYTCTRQRADGSWWYGEDEKYHWIDNFHTGYNLSALKIYSSALQDATFASHLARGHRYFKRHFFESDGRAKYFHDRLYPIDIQCCAQAIDTLTAMADDDPESLTLAHTVAGWTIRHMQHRDGHFNYRHLGWTVVTTPMLHWGQGTMIKALASLRSKIRADHVATGVRQLYANVPNG